MEWKHFTERVNGVNIHFVAQGEGEPVILLHGWPEFWYSWRNQLPVLGESYRAIAPDMRGFGYSDKPLSGYDTRTAASDMYELARALGDDQQESHEETMEKLLAVWKLLRDGDAGMTRRQLIEEAVRNQAAEVAYRRR